MTKKSKGKNPGDKGGIGERAVARLFTEWITGSPVPEIMWRSSMSGGKATLLDVERHTMEGDLVPLDRRAFFLFDRAVIEIKNRKASNVLDLIEPRDDCVTISKGEKTKGKRLVRPNPYCWWQELRRIAHRAGKRPLLVFKRYQSKHWYLVIDADEIYKIASLQELVLPVPRIFASFDRKEPSCFVLRLDVFFDYVTPKVFALLPILRVPKYKRVQRA